MTFKKKTLKEHVALAWRLIEQLALNDNTGIGGSPRFSLVDKKGYRQTDPAKAACLYDMGLGKAFLPQTDPEWIDQLMTRYRVSVQWMEDMGCWRAQVGPQANLSHFGYGQTPGVAMVEALVAASEGPEKPVKVDYPGWETNQSEVV